MRESLGAPAKRGGEGMVLVQGCWWRRRRKRQSGGAERVMKIACPQLRVPGRTPDVLDADSFINANLTA